MGIQKQNVCSFPEHLGLHNVFYILSNTDKVIFLISPQNTGWCSQLRNEQPFSEQI